MNAATEKTVRELALEQPGATRVFEKLGIDYCCGGNRSLQEACQSANLSLDDVLNSLAAAEHSPRQGARGPLGTGNWQTDRLAALIEHIKSTHHKYTREEIARLGPLFAKVCSVHGKNHPELIDMQSTFQALAQELTMHMMKEEMVLFPYLARMEAALNQKQPVSPAPFGSVANPVAAMEHEHDSAGNALRTLRQASNGFTAPADACISYQTLYKALSDFEADLHQHIHLENNILFPRAVALEQNGG